jgi:hypothetical protein
MTSVAVSALLGIRIGRTICSDTPACRSAFDCRKHLNRVCSMLSDKHACRMHFHSRNWQNTHQKRRPQTAAGCDWLGPPPQFQTVPTPRQLPSKISSRISESQKRRCSADYQGLASTLLVLAGSRIRNHKFLHGVASLESCDQPAWLLASPGPSFGRLLRISVFWKYAWILSPLPWRAVQGLPVSLFGLSHLSFAPKLRQSLFKLTLLRC